MPSAITKIRNETAIEQLALWIHWDVRLISIPWNNMAPLAAGQYYSGCRMVLCMHETYRAQIYRYDRKFGRSLDSLGC